ncbi:putative ribonuclease H-like domain-containing protein [Tanacetum coccineum]
MLRSCWKLLKRDLLVSQLELLDEKLSQEDVNQKLLRSLSPEWNTHAVVWRNKADLDTMSMDDLYNNLKVYEPEFKGMSNLSSSTQNMAFVSSLNNNTSNTNEAVNTAHGSDHAEEGPNYTLMAFSSSSSDSKGNHQNFAKKTHPCAKKNLVPRAVLMKSGLVSINTARQVNAAHSKTTVNAARPMSYLSKIAHSTVKRPIYKNTAFKNKYGEIDGGYVDLSGGEPLKEGNNRKGTIKTRESSTEPLFVIDDYSRFTWVFFLATKDETSGILKSFITGIENLVDHKVKVIRCDNGTEFKNKEMNQFCEMKGILRQFSVARTPQQNGVAERRNRTLIEAARIRSRPDWVFDIDALTRTVNYEPIVARIKSNGFAGTKASDNAVIDEKKVDEDPRKDSECKDQEKEDNVNSTNTVNAAGTNEVNAVGGKTSIELPFDPNMPALEDYSIFDYSSNDKDDGAEADMNNLDTTIQVSPIPTTRIHKDHPLDQVIRDLQSATQTRKMSKNLKEHRKHPKSATETVSGCKFHNKQWYVAAFKLLVDKEKKLIIDYESKMAYQLLKFIIKQLKKLRSVWKHPPDEAVYKELGDNLVRAATTASSLEAEHDNGNINKTQSKATPNESSFLGTTLGGGPRVLDLEKTKTTQHNEIASLKRRVKKLEKKNRSRTYKLKRLYKGRINDIDADEEITLVSVQNVDEEMFDVNVLDGEEGFVAEQEVAANEKDDDGEITLAQALIEMKSTKPKVKGVVIQEPGKSTTTKSTSTISLQQSQDKGKGILIELVEPIKKKDLIRLDEEVALKLQAEFNEKERLAREKVEKVEEANIALIETWDDIQAKIDVDHQLAKTSTITRRVSRREKKQTTNKSSTEKDNVYLPKEYGRIQAQNLKLKDFDSIQEMFDRAFKRVNTSEDFRTKLVEGKEKRGGTELIQETTKKQKVEDDKEIVKLKQCLEIIPDEEELTIDAIFGFFKSPRIVDWKIY